MSWLMCAVAVAAAALVLIRVPGHADTPVDRALPLLALLIVTIGWVNRGREAGPWIVLGAPLLLLLSVCIADEGLRLAGYGVTFALALIAGVVTASRSMRLDLRVGLLLLLAGVIPLRFLPWETVAPVPALLFCAGLVALVLALAVSSPQRDAEFAAGGSPSETGSRTPPFQVLPLMSVSVAQLCGALVIAAAAPELPDRLSLFPLFAALLVMILRKRSLGLALAALLVAALLGKWWLAQWFLVVAISTGTSMIEKRAGFSVARTLTTWAPAATALLLLSAAAWMRPAMALLFVLGAIVTLLAGDQPDKLVTALLLPLAALMVSLFAWSGVLSATFPLPVSLLALSAFAVISLLRFFEGKLASAVTTLLLIALFFVRAVPAVTLPVGVSLAAGESFNLHPEHRTKAVSLVLSGVDISGLERGRVLGRFEALDRNARGYRKDILVGDVSDWGAFRAQHFFYTKNPFPANPAGRLSGYGRKAFLEGAGRLEIRAASDITMIRVSAGLPLPATARIQIQQVEYGDE